MAATDRPARCAQQNSLARCDFVAGGEHSFLDSRAIQKGAVAAFLVDDAAAAGAAFHGEVHAGHAIVVGNCKLGAIGCATNQECLASWKRDLPPRDSVNAMISICTDFFVGTPRSSITYPTVFRKRTSIQTGLAATSSPCSG
jgi:hypothetical protein